MTVLSVFRGLPQVARQEFWVNLRSIRFLIMAMVLALIVVGGAYGISSVGGGGGPIQLIGADLALFFMIAFVNLIVPIFAIVITFDAVSKERVQGTMDLLLSRPVTRTGVLLGKFLGSFAAVAFPTVVVMLAGIGIVAAKAGSGPDATFAGTFFAMTLLLIAYYVLLQLVFSSLAKTGGTAVLYGVLVWLLLNILYGVVTLVIGLVLFPDPAARNEFNTLSTLGNPGGIAGNIMLGAAPDSIRAFAGGILEPSLAAGGAIFWFVFLMILALWTFQRKALE